MQHALLFLSVAALLSLSQCKQDAPSPLSQLPPATQTGANTFGCLVNGKPWTPQGNDGTANYTVSYDRLYRGGNIDIKVYRIEGKFFQYIVFGGDSIASVRQHSLVKGPRTIYFTDSNQPTACQEYSGQAGQYRRGTLTITRLDLTAGIISGTFNFTLYKPGCDSIRVTDGRFDYQL